MRWLYLCGSLWFCLSTAASAQVFYTPDSLFKAFSYMQVALQELPETAHRRDSAHYRGAIHFDYCEEAIYAMLEDLILDGDSTARLRDIRKKLDKSELFTGSSFLMEFERMELHWCPLLRGYRSAEVILRTLMGYDCRALKLKIQMLLAFDLETRSPKLEICVIHPASQRWYFLSYAHEELSGLSNRTLFNQYFKKCQQRDSAIETSDGALIELEETLNREVQAFWRRWNWSCE